MDDHERLIRIDERQSQIFSRLEDIYEQVKKTNGRVTELETYRETHDQKANNKIIQIEDHEERLSTIESVYLQGKGSWKMVKIIAATCVGMGSIIAIILEFFIKH